MTTAAMSWPDAAVAMTAIVCVAAFLPVMVWLLDRSGPGRRRHAVPPTWTHEITTTTHPGADLEDGAS